MYFMAQSNAGVFMLPDSPMVPVQMTAGSDQLRFNMIRRVLPITAATADSRGNATKD